MIVSKQSKYFVRWFWLFIYGVLVPGIPSYSIPATATIGGIFKSFDYPDNTAISVSNGQQHLSAFLLAIEEINNNTNLLPLTSLQFLVNQGPSSKTIASNTYYEGAAASSDITFASPEPLQAVVVSTSDSQLSKSAVQTIVNWNIPGIVSEPTPVGQNSISILPLTIQLSQSDIYQAVGLANWLFWNQIGIFYSTSSFGASCYSRFRRSMRSDVEIQFAYAIPDGTTDFGLYIRGAKLIGTTIFLVFMDATSTGSLLEQGYNAKLFVQDTQVIGTSAASDAAIWGAMSSTANVAAIMRGYLTMVPYPSLYFQTPAGETFLKTLRSQPATYFPSTGNCSQATDDGKTTVDRNNKLFQVPTTLNVSNTNQTCLGYSDYEVFNSNGSNIDPHILFTYDAVYTLAYAMDEMITKQIEITGPSVYAYLVNSFSKELVTGTVSFDPSSEEVRYRGRGQRTSVGIYALRNFNAELYKNSNGTLGFATVGYYDTPGLMLCNDIKDTSAIQLPGCKSIVYNTKGDGSQPPTGIKADKRIAMASLFVVVLVLMILALLLLQVYQLYFILRYYTEREIRNAQPKIILFMLLGSFWGSVWIFVNALPVTSGACIVSFWTGHMMILTIFVPFQLKLWRIHKIVSATPFKRIQVTENRILSFLLAIIAMSLALVTAITAVGSIGVNDFVTYDHRQRILQPYCTPPETTTGAALYYVLISYEIGLLLSAIRFMYLTRAVPSYINEISIIGPVFAFSLLWFFAAVMIYFFVPMNLDNQKMVVCTTVFVALFCGPAAYIYNKRHRLIARKQDDNSYATLFTGTTREEEMPVDPERNLQPNQRNVLMRFMLTIEDNEDIIWEGIMFVNQLSNSRAGMITKAKLCQEQIFLWTTVLVRLKEAEDESNSRIRREMRDAADISLEVAIENGDRASQPASPTPSEQARLSSMRTTQDHISQHNLRTTTQRRPSSNSNSNSNSNNNNNNSNSNGNGNGRSNNNSSNNEHNASTNSLSNLPMNHTARIT